MRSFVAKSFAFVFGSFRSSHGKLFRPSSFWSSPLVPITALLLTAPCTLAQTADFSGVQYAVVPSVSHPSAIAMDMSSSANNGSLFVASYDGFVNRYTLSGSTWTLAGTVPSSGTPYGLTVDSRGDLYIADNANGTIYEDTLNPSTHAYTQSTILSNLNNPWGLAFDSSGRLYVAAKTDDSVYQYTFSGSAWELTKTFNIGRTVAGVAVDSAFNVYITSDDTSGVAIKETYQGGGNYSSSTTLTNAANGTTAMTDIKVDAAGNLYIVDQGRNRVLKESLEGGSYIQSTLGSGFSSETGVFVDPTGVLYVADQNNNQVVSINPNGVSLGTTPVGTVSTTTVSIPFTFSFGAIGSIAVLTQGTTSLDFANAHSGSCRTNNTYNIGDVCTVAVTFTPTQIGMRYGAVVLYGLSGKPFATANLYGMGTGPLVNFTPYTQTMLPGTFSHPEGISGDGNGDLFIADSGNLYEETYSSGNYMRSTIVASTDTVLGHHLSSTQWVATDGAGNLYLADGGNSRVLKIPLSSSGTYSESAAIAICSSGCGGNEIAVDPSGNVYTLSAATAEIQKFTLQPDGSYELSVPYSGGLSNPWGIAIDSSGDIFFTDANNHKLYELAYSNGTYANSPTTLDNTLNTPNGIARDNQGNIYIADSGAGTIVKETFGGGSTYTPSTVLSSLNSPYGIFVDNANNLYVGNQGGGTALKFDTSDSPTVSFPNTDVGQSSTPIIYTLTDQGTAALNFSVPSSGTNPSWSSPFSVALGSGSECPELTTSSSPQTLSAGYDCNLPITFTPTVGGVVSSTISIKTNNLNATSTQQINASGKGIVPAPTVTSISPGAGPIAGGTAVTITGTGLSSATGIKFGGNAGVIVSDTATQIVATSPAASAGTVDVTITTAGGTSATTVADEFTYAAIPTVSGVSPVQGPIGGGTAVTITGTNLSSATGVTFGANSGAIVSNSLTQIVVTSPTGSVGKVDVTVTTGGGTSATSTADQYTYYPASPVGTATGTLTGTLTITRAGTGGTITIWTQGATGANLDFQLADATGTCYTNGTSHSYSLNDTCTVHYTFNPTHPWQRLGGLTLTDGSGNILGTAYLTGIGTGPQTTFTPATGIPASTLGGGFSYPASTPVDGNGNIYVADGNTGKVSKVPPGCASYSCLLPVGGGFFSPYGLALDSVGNLYVADNSSAIKVVPPGCQSSSCVTSRGGGFFSTQGVAVDASGNIYVADAGGSSVSRMPALCASSSCVTKLGGGFRGPHDVKVDASGNIYVTDTYNSAVKMMPQGCASASCVTTLGGGFSAAIYGLALDGVGNIYIADDGPHVVKIMPPACSSSACVTTFASGFHTVYGVALDSGGNVYVTDYSGEFVTGHAGSSVTKLDIADPPALTSPSTPVGVPGPQQVVALGNNGNATLTLSALTATGASFGGAATTCTAPGTLTAGSSCNLGIEFVPATASSLSGSATVTSNTENATTPQTITISSTALVPMVTSISPASGSTVGGTNVTIIGTNLASAITVYFGTNAGTIVSATSTKIVATSPSGGPGAVDVTVGVLGGGVSATSAVDRFTFVAGPTVTGISPTTGPTSGGTSISITGTSFTGASAVTFGGVPAASFTVINATSILATSPSGVVGINDIVVTAANGSSATVAADQFTEYLSQSIGSSSVPQTATVTLSAAGTVASIYVLTQASPNLDFQLTTGGTCATQAYNLNDTCTVHYTFTPTHPWIRTGGINLTDASGNILGSTLLSGTGVGPQIAFTATSANVASLGGGLGVGVSIAIDGAGDLYAGDSANNAVEMVPAGCNSAACVTSLSLGIQNPAGVAIDGAGDLFIASSSANTVNFVPAGCNSSACVQQLGGGFSNPVGIALDASNHVYIADSNNNAVKVMAPTCTNSACVSTLGGGFNTPKGVAVDSSGNVYVVDEQNHAVEIVPSGCVTSACVTTIGGGFSLPSGVSIDPFGNVYVTDTDSLKTIPSGCTSALCVQSLVTGLGNAASVSRDASGNLYIGSGSSSITEILVATPPTLSYPTTVAGFSSPQQVVTLGNIGNNNLAFTAFTPSNADFNGAATTCVGAASLTPGTNCALGIEFAPTAPGNPLAGSVTIADNTLNINGATQTISLSGIALPQTPTVTAISPASGGSSGGTTVTLTGTYFHGATAVTFGMTPATNFSVTSVSSITAVVPPGSGLVHVTVTTPIATSAATSASQFSYLSATTAVASTTLTANVAANFTPVTALGGLGSLTYSISPALPAGLSLNAMSGTIIGTPSHTILASTFTVTATDSNGATASAAFSLTVSVPSLTLFPATLPAATFGALYSQALVAVGGTTPYTYSIASGSLPAGLTLSSGGILSGTPTAGQTASFTVLVFDSSSGSGPYSASFAYTLAVNPAPPALAFTAGIASAAYTYGQTPVAISATSASKGAVTYSVLSGPATIMPTSGLLTFTGAGTVVLQATQAATANYTLATAQVTLTVAQQATATTVTTNIPLTPIYTLTPPNSSGVSTVVTTLVAEITPIQPISFTATIAPLAVGSPTGSVVFYDNGTALGSPKPLPSGSTQVQFGSLLLLSGSHVITAVYSGDSNFLSAPTTSTLNISVAPLTFNFTGCGGGTLGDGIDYEAQPGQTVTVLCEVYPDYNIYPSPVTFAAASGAWPSTVPTPVAANGGTQWVSFTITIPSNAVVYSSVRHPSLWSNHSGILAALLLPICAFRRLRKRSRSLRVLSLLLAATFASTFFTGCDAGGGDDKQTYTDIILNKHALQVSATSGGITQTRTIVMYLTPKTQ